LLLIPSRASNENVERLLRGFINDIRVGKRESSVLSTGSLSTDEKEQWRQLRRELQSIGITPEIFAHNRELILNTLRALSQNEIEYSRVNLAATEEEECAPGHHGDVADDSSESESQEEKSAPEHLGDVADDSSEAGSQGDRNILPRMRANDTIDSAAGLLASVDQTPREGKSDEWAASSVSSVSSRDSPFARNLGNSKRQSRSSMHLELGLMSSNTEDDGHRPASSHSVVTPSNRTQIRAPMSHDDLEPSSLEEWAYILSYKDLKKKRKHSRANWSIAGDTGVRYGGHRTIYYQSKHTCIAQ